MSTYNVSKRFTIWVETTIEAEDFQKAVVKAQALKPMDFAKFKKPMNDWESLEGLSVSEDW